MVNHDKLTIQQIIEAFPDECKTILPRELRRVKKELKPWHDRLQAIADAGYDTETYNFAILVSEQHRPTELLNHYNHLTNIKKALSAPQDGTITPYMIAKAKEAQILPLYAFQRIRTGNKRWSASCPFHTDKTPSFTVYNGTSFHCFSCQKSGDTIAFYMAISGQNFKNSVLFLSNSIG